MTDRTISMKSNPRAGNMFIYILGAIFLVGILIVILKGNVQEGAGIDAERVSIKVNEVKKYASELERAVNYILRNGTSESDIRFANANAVAAYGVITDIPSRQVFDPAGGGAEYKLPPSGINDGSKWQFYATTHIKNLGNNDTATQKAELIAVLPNVTQDFCQAVNTSVGQVLDLTVNQDLSANGCINAGAGNEFAGTFQSGSSVNTLVDTLFTKLPAKEACVKCESGGFHYYRVLIAR